MIAFVDHVNIVVQDMERMVAFYRDLLGLRVTKQATIRGPWIEAVTGLSDVAADVIYLAPETGPGIELIRYRTPEGTRPPALEAPNTAGIRHIAFRVGDVQELADAVRAAGGRLLSDVQHVAVDQVDYGQQRKRMCYCLDPEGNLLELMTLEFG
jgi:catechol 2,3-dioxygenase-like lactoylglutathione lyase family enzyme